MIGTKKIARRFGIGNNILLAMTELYRSQTDQSLLDISGLMKK
jgi:hypothetical protein